VTGSLLFALVESAEVEARPSHRPAKAKRRRASTRP
jgi:hypothetical protein